jgi:tRNA pseudouridine38-40 synthase
MVQVRLMVGLLKSVGTGDLTTEDVERILNLKAVTAAPPMAPACGLYLANVKYDLSV